MIDFNQIRKAKNALIQSAFQQDSLVKAKGHPIGTKKTYGGREYIKTAQGWKYAGKGNQKQVDAPNSNQQIDAATSQSKKKHEDASTEHDAVIESQGKLTIDTLDPDTEDTKYKQGDIISHRGKQYVVGSEIEDGIHSLTEKTQTSKPSLSSLRATVNALLTSQNLKASVSKSTKHPNFLTINIKYPTGSGALSVGGTLTSSGQQRKQGSQQAIASGEKVSSEIQNMFDVEDISVEDLGNGTVQVFAVSDQFTSLQDDNIKKALQTLGVQDDD